MKRKDLSNIMTLAWGFVHRNGYTLSEALKAAWANFKLKARMRTGIVRFYFRKVDGTIREAWGTLADRIIPETKGSGIIPETKGSDRKNNPTIQAYFDTEKSEWRCFKTANLIEVP